MSDTDILDGLVYDYLDACEAIDKHTTVKEQLAAQIIDLLGVGGRREVAPGVGVRVQAPPQRFDPAKAKAVLTDEQYQSICEAKPSSTLASKMLPGLLVDQCKTADGKSSLRRL